LTAGEKGMRFSLPNSRVMVHQPSGGYQGQATDIMIHARETEAEAPAERDLRQAHRQRLCDGRGRAGARQFHVGRGCQGLGSDRRDPGKPRKSRRFGIVTPIIPAFKGGNFGLW
jgi:hypothetical protein